MFQRTLPLMVFPAVKLVLHLVTHRGYGMFRDEYYYLACAERLAWGYVDHPPFSIFLLWIVRNLLGDSLLAVRLLPALAGAATVLLVGLMARRLGGGLFAQSLAMVGALAAPIYLALDHYYSMNAFDLLFWALAAYLILLLVQGAGVRVWLLLGAVLGLGLMNKISILWLGFGLLVGLLVTQRRRWLLTPGPWLAAGLAVLLFLPYILWQVGNDWPTVEFIRNASGQKMLEVKPLDFMLSQLRVMNPAVAPLWLAGLAWLLASARGAPFRMLGWMYVAVFLLLILNGTSRAGYLAPAYTWLLAAGGVASEELFHGRRWGALRWPAAASLVLAGVVVAPLALPVLPVNSYILYAESLGIAPSTAERKEVAQLPQFYADMHGWDSIVDTVAGVYHTLPPEEQKVVAIFTYNYGDAGAIDLLGRKHGLPPAIGGHNNYWLWGPREFTGDVVLVLGNDRESLEESFEQVELGAMVDCGHCMPYENHRPVWICRKLRRPLAEAWPRLKHFD